MELQYYGANCLRITTKKAAIVIDDNLAELGLKTITKPTDISLNTHAGIPDHEARFKADMPGEYEISGVAIHGIAARSHMDPVRSKTSQKSADSRSANRTSNGMDEPDAHNAVIYTISADDLKVAILGHIYPELSDDQLEQIGLVDIAVVPVGGNGYTLDGAGALQIIKKLEPKVIIPTHYAGVAIKYQVPQAELAEALKALAMEPSETLDKYKPKAAEFTDTARLIVLKSG
ncbi:MBL fold metallo-hydrolase [Candidatus Saccharibacteria bacterium]|nr:MBL fold metallo-hydrolase [Candidatus Saccharibacteria bacterium]